MFSCDIARPVSRRRGYRVTAATIYTEVNGIGSRRYRFASKAAVHPSEPRVRPIAAKPVRQTPSTFAVLGWAGGGEEVDEQLCDALGLVVVDPVRRVGQALDAVEVGDVLLEVPHAAA
jgi:hypothetical protein